MLFLFASFCLYYLPSQIHSFFNEVILSVTLLDSLVFPLETFQVVLFLLHSCHNNNKKISLFPFPFQPNVCLGNRYLAMLLSPFSFLFMLLVSYYFSPAFFFLGPSIWSSQQSTHSSIIITLSVNFWLIIN